MRLLVGRIAGSQDSAIVATVLEALERSLPRGYPWPGNALVEKLRSGELTAPELLAQYCAMLYRRLGTYAEVAKRTGLDPRTARKYVDGGK